MGKYLAFAQLRAQQTGESVEYMTESIITGLARQSIPILDNLGLSAVELNKEAAKTGSIFSAAGVIIDRSMAQSGKAIDTAGSKIERMNAKWENTKVAVGNALLSTFDFLSQIKDIGNPVSKMANDLEESERQRNKERQDLLRKEAQGLTIEQLTLKLKEARLDKDKLAIQTYDSMIKQAQKLEQAEKERNAVSINNINLQIEGLQFQRDKLDVEKDSREIGKINAQIAELQLKLEEANGTAAKKRLATQKAIADANKKMAEQNKQNLIEEAAEREAAATAGAKEVEEILLSNKALQLKLDAETKIARMKSQLVGETDKLTALELESNIAYMESELKKLQLVEEVEDKIRKDDTMTAETELALRQNLNAQLALLDAELAQKRVDLSKKTEEALRDEAKKTAKTQEQLFKEVAEYAKNNSAEILSAAIGLTEALSENGIARIKEDGELANEALSQQLERGQITEQEYQRRKEASDAQFRARELAIRRRQAVLRKAEALFNIALSTNEAIAKNAGNPFLIALVAAIGAAQAAAVLAQPLPKYAKGTKFVKGEGFANGIDTVPALLTKGERVIDAKTNQMYWDDLNAIQDKRIRPTELSDISALVGELRKNRKRTVVHVANIGDLKQTQIDPRSRW
jgi:hypothetical protein